MRDRGNRRYANVRKLMRLARQFEAAEGRDLGAFLRFAAARTARGQREALAATEAEDHDGVRIMTIHAAKGLEFDTVAVADLGRPLNSGGGWTDIRLGTPGDAGDEGDADETPRQPSIGIQLGRAGEGPLTLWDFERLKRQASVDDAAEELRLTYVAMTRAREHLLLSASFNDNDLEGGDALGRSALKRILPELGFTGAETELEHEQLKLSVRIERASAEAAADLVRRAATEPRPRMSRRAPLPCSRRSPTCPSPATSHTQRSPTTSAAATASTPSASWGSRASTRAPTSRRPQESDEMLGEADLAAASGDEIPGPACATPARVRKRRPRPARVERSQPLGGPDARALRGPARPGGDRRRPA